MTAPRVTSVPEKMATLAAALVLCCTLNGCMVAGYTSGEGWWTWPGSIVITLLIALLLFLMRRH